jgi:hypothetical protein
MCLTGCGGASSTLPANVSVSLRPKRVAVVVTQTQQFQATVTGDPKSLGVTWGVDGIASGNATVGSIGPTGRYTPPASGGRHTITATSVADGAKSASASVAVTDLPGVFTYHNNPARDGTNSQEYGLTATTVASATFGKLFACGVDAPVYTQPLWVPNLTIGGATHNVIFIATQADSAYAFDADASPCLELWHANLIDAAHGAKAGEAPVLTGDVGNGFKDIQPTIGVTGTPVIDPTSNTMYVVSKSAIHSSLSFFQRLHALDLATGNEVTPPATISASVAGTGDGSSGGILSFDPQTQHQRPALALLGGVVYIGWASHEDKDPYHCWIIGYEATTLARVKVFNGTPDGSRGGTWMAGGAPAVDGGGNLYFTTGNGTFDANSVLPPNHDYGDTVVRLNNGTTVADWFTPYNQALLEMVDLDLGSSGVVLLPDRATSPQHLLVSGGKQGVLYLLDRDAMGHYCSGCASDTNARQTFPAFAAFFGTPAFWENGLYFAGSGDNLKLLTFDPGSGLFNLSPTSQSLQVFNFPGATPSISSQGTTNGVVWAIDSSRYGVPSSSGSGAAILHAYRATNLATELWNSSQAGANRDQAGLAVKFTVPTVANGRVYIGTRTEVDVYGLLPN